MESVMFGASFHKQESTYREATNYDAATKRTSANRTSFAGCVW